MSNIIAIVGRPNVGKSTLFNRIIKNRVSIVEDSPGVTRDRIYSYANWLTKQFILIDTGGITLDETSYFKDEITFQAKIAIQEADIIFFVLSYKDGIMLDDKEIAKILYKSSKKIILVVNKYDSKDYDSRIYEYMKFGFGEPILVSSAHGIGVGDLLDQAIKIFDNKKNNDNKNKISFSIIGKPNVGKSSLINSILGENRVIVSSKPGTTTDSIDTFFSYNKNKFIAIDTAGIRQKSRIIDKIEKYSWIRSINSIDRSDIVLLTIDCVAGIKDLDATIAGFAFDANKPIIIVLNKIDLLKDKEKDYKNLTNEIKNKFKFLSYSHIVFVSALENNRIQKLLEVICDVYYALHKRIQTSILNEVLVKAQLINPAPNFNGGRLKIFYTLQLEGVPPSFVIFVNNKKYLHFSYKRYIENQIRNNFNFKGINIKLIFRNRGNK